MSTGSVQFSVVIPTFARPQRLASCLAAVAKLQFPKDQYEVIVVDDGSSEPLDKTVEPFRAELRLSLARQSNAGPAAARNAGAARAVGSYLAFTDDDCEVDPNWLTALADRMRQTPEALVGGRITNSLPDNAFSAASQAITDCTYDRMQHRGGDKLFATCNIAVGASAFQKLGGFSTRFPLAAGEDYDFCHRWQRAGFAAIFAPEAIVNHSHDLTLAKFVKQHFSYGRGLLRFRRRATGGVFSSIRTLRIWDYLELLRWPLRHGRGLSAWKQSALVALSQLATAAGAARESFARNPGNPEAPAGLQKEPS